MDVVARIRGELRRQELGGAGEEVRDAGAGNFALPLAALVDAGLVALDDRVLELSPRGMFYADAVVSLLAFGARSVDAGAGVHTRDLLKELPQSGDYLGMG